MCHSIDPTTQPLHGSQSALFGTLNGRSRTPAILGESEGWAGEVFGSVLLPSPSAVGYPAGRLCHGASADDGHARRLHHLYPQGRFEIPRFRPNIVVAPASGEKGLRRECLGRLHARHRRFCSLEHHRSVWPLCHDDLGPRGPATRSGHLAHRGATQQGQCRHLCDSRARRLDPSR